MSCLQRLFSAPWLILQSVPAIVLLLDPSPAWAALNVTSLILNGGRARIVQLCVVFMCLGLFIIMRRWTESCSRRRSDPPSGPASPPAP